MAVKIFGHGLPHDNAVRLSTAQGNGMQRRLDRRGYPGFDFDLFVLIGRHGSLNVDRSAFQGGPPGARTMLSSNRAYLWRIVAACGDMSTLFKRKTTSFRTNRHYLVVVTWGTQHNSAILLRQLNTTDVWEAQTLRRLFYFTKTCARFLKVR